MTPMRPRCEDGASAVEYSLLVVAIAAVIAITVFAVGVLTQDSYRDACSKISSGAESGSAEC
jgi:pilus assembly protein Flp/PilA